MPFAYAVAALAAATLAPNTAMPIATAIAHPAAKVITGFRSAHFRMSPREVRKAIAADFPGVSVAERIQPTEGTRVLQLTAPNLDPGPGPAVVSYVFGATTRTLALVSVTWATKAEATADDRQAIALAGLRLNNHLRASPQPRTVLAPKVIRPGTVSLYGALDANGAGVINREWRPLCQQGCAHRRAEWPRFTAPVVHGQSRQP